MPYPNKVKIMKRKNNISVKKFLSTLYWNSPRSFMPFLIDLRFRKRFKNKVKITYTNKMFKISEENDNRKDETEIFFYHPLRVTRYLDGIDTRLDLLLRDYCIDQIEDLENGIFIDVGSNVGEFSIALSKKYPNSKFIRFEPSPEECDASEHNMKFMQDHLIPKALWKEKAILSFYNRNNEGDSSLFAPDNQNMKTTVETSTLDIEMSNFQFDAIQLLKLEAEGAEPEILLGGKETLKRCRYVTADLGPERGINKEETYEDANRILTEYGFSLVGRNTGSRKCFLYKNSKF